MTATVANGPANAADWVGLYRRGLPTPANRLAYQYLNGLRDAARQRRRVGPALTFTLPTTPGRTDVRFFRNNTFTVLATSDPITVLGPSIGS